MPLLAEPGGVCVCVAQTMSRKTSLPCLIRPCPVLITGNSSPAYTQLSTVLIVTIVSVPPVTISHSMNCELYIEKGILRADW